MVEPSGAVRLLASYGRQRGRKLRPGKQALIDGLLSQLALGLDEVTKWRGGAVADLFPSRHSSSPPSFEGPRQLWLEIGFGAGEHIAHQAARYPQAGIIGCEPYVPGIAWLLKHIDTHMLDNIRIYTQDARLLLDALPDTCLDKAFILYPDPWPKLRHHKRRLVSRATLDRLARVMKPGATLRLATDDADYCTWMFEHLLTHPAFAWQAKSCDDWLIPWADWFSTRYEQKALKEGRVPTYLTFVRR